MLIKEIKLGKKMLLRFILLKGHSFEGSGIPTSASILRALDVGDGTLRNSLPRNSTFNTCQRANSLTIRSPVYKWLSETVGFPLVFCKRLGAKY